jgi:hypothetical protein
MLSKCANPGCVERFRYLHQGKLFYMHPIPELREFVQKTCEHPYERFWLCDVCAQKFTLIWDGLNARVVDLPPSAPLDQNVGNEEEVEQPTRVKVRGAAE